MNPKTNNANSSFASAFLPYAMLALVVLFMGAMILGMRNQQDSFDKRDRYRESLLQSRPIASETDLARWEGTGFDPSHAVGLVDITTPGVYCIVDLTSGTTEVYFSAPPVYESTQFVQFNPTYRYYLMSGGVEAIKYYTDDIGLTPYPSTVPNSALKLGSWNPLVRTFVGPCPK